MNLLSITPRSRTAWLGLAAAAGIVFLGNVWSVPARGGEAISIVGSSTVYPFVKKAADIYRRETSTAFHIESTGTGAGMHYFCAGTGDAFPDMVNASRPMRPAELQSCQANGVRQVIGVELGFDGLAVVESKRDVARSLTSDDLFRAISAWAPKSEGMAKNNVRLWSDIRSNLPAEPILVLGPPKTSGTRDFLESEFLLPVCRDLAVKAGVEDVNADLKVRCKAIRTDGAYIDAGEDDAFLLDMVSRTNGFVGLVGFGNVFNFHRPITLVPVDGVRPSLQTIGDKSYKLSRPLFVYINADRLEANPVLEQFVNFLISGRMIGADGELVRIGLAPPVAARRDMNVQKVKTRENIACPSVLCAPLK